MEAGGVGGVTGGLGPKLPPVKYPHFRVTAANRQLVGEDGIEADGGDGKNQRQRREQINLLRII